MNKKNIGKQAIRFHHISSHFANGLLPVSFLFLLLFLLTGKNDYETASFLMALTGLCASPFTYITGILDWKIRFKSASTPLFQKKIRAGLALLIIGVIIVGIRFFMGADTLYGSSLFTGVYLCGNGVMTLLVFYLGYLGGKFLFR